MKAGKPCFVPETFVNLSQAKELIRRVLVSPQFDRTGTLGLREMAAWSAYRLGDPRMLSALKNAVVRRDGRDARVFIYLALSEGQRALPVLDEYRVGRMRYLKWTRGLEMETLDKIARDLRAGRSLEWFAVPPEQLDFGRVGWSPIR